MAERSPSSTRWSSRRPLGLRAASRPSARRRSEATGPGAYRPARYRLADVAAGPVEDAGEFTTCPSCGAEVRKKAMIPVLRAIVPAGYLCRDCARATLADRAPSDGAG